MKTQHSLFDTLLEPVFILNAEQKVVYANETAAIIAGLTIRKMTRGMKFTEIFELSETLDYLENLVAVQDPTPYKELNFKTSQGGEGKIQITCQALHAEGADVAEKQWIVFFRDVTLEERLQKKYRAELEQKEDVIKALEDAKLQLENYSRNLEKMVQERTQELSNLNKTMSALLDSLGQGFFIFNDQGVILDVSSKACENTIEVRPNGKLIWDILKLPPGKVEGFKKWMQTVFMEMLPFEDLSPLGPTSYPHSLQRHIALEYHPLRSDAGSMEGIVVVASDITSLVEAQQVAETEKEHAKLIIHMIKSKREIQRFIQESKVLLAEMRSEVSQDEGPTHSEALYRHLHTLKGGAALFSVKEMVEACHQAETILTDLTKSFSQANYIALRAKCFEVEETFNDFLAETKEILGNSAMSAERQIEVALSKLNEIARKVGTLPGGGPVAERLLLELAMEPVLHFLTPYNDVALKTAEKMDKMLLPLNFTADDVMVIPEIYNGLFSTLVHAYRNAVDHGIETPDVRVASGKPAAGAIDTRVQVLQSPAGAMLSVQIQDDGAGIDPQKIRSKFLQKGLDLKEVKDFDVLQHIFDSQFSTKDQVTDISGRGVGMDAIKVAAEELQGKVWVESVIGKGTSLHIQVPYFTEIPRLTEKQTAA